MTWTYRVFSVYALSKMLPIANRQFGIVQISSSIA